MICSDISYLVRVRYCSRTNKLLTASVAENRSTKDIEVGLNACHGYCFAAAQSFDGASISAIFSNQYIKYYVSSMKVFQSFDETQWAKGTRCTNSHFDIKPGTQPKSSKTFRHSPWLMSLFVVTQVPKSSQKYKRTALQCQLLIRQATA